MSQPCPAHSRPEPCTHLSALTFPPTPVKSLLLFASADGRVEGGARAGRWQLHGAQACGADADLYHGEQGGWYQRRRERQLLLLHAACCLLLTTCPPLLPMLLPTLVSLLRPKALMELIGDILPPGVLNVVTGYGDEAGAALASSKGIAKIGFTGSTATGTDILKAAADSLIPATMELGGKSPNIFFSSVADEDDALFDKAVEGAVLFALNQGEVCTCQSRLLVQEDIFDKFMERVVARTEAIVTGDPLDPATMMGAQVSSAQHDRIVNYLNVGEKEGAKVLTGGSANDVVDGGYYVKRECIPLHLYASPPSLPALTAALLLAPPPLATIVHGTNDMQVFQEEIFGPVTGVTTFKDEAEAIAIANDTIYGLGAGVWTRDAHQAYQVPRAIQAGRVWVNCYHAYPAHAPFGGYKASGFGRETHKMVRPCPSTRAAAHQTFPALR